MTRALPDAGERARRRVLEKFSYEMRREGLWSELEAALRCERTSATPHR